jgi:Spy/CpxP family protein refolding chaperone
MKLKAIKTLLAVGIACLYLANATALWGGEMQHGWQCFTHNVKLTPDQESKVKAIYDRYAETTKNLREQLAAAESSQADSVGAFDEVQFRSAAEARARLQVELEVAFARAKAEAENVLTPDQKTQLEEHLKQMKAHCHNSHD